MATKTGEPGTIRLGTYSDVTVSVARTDRAWELELDAIVLSVGGYLGGLGDAIRHQFPNAGWDSVDYSAITPQRPHLLTLQTRGSRDSALQFAILATPHAQGMNREPTMAAIRLATRSAITTAARAGATVVGLPLLATGRLSFDPEPVAATMLDAAIAALDEARPHGIRELVFVGIEVSILTVLPRAWERVVNDLADIAEPQVRNIAEPPRSGELPRSLAGGVARDLVDPSRGIPLSEDQLGVAPYASMLATVIADRRTPLPLSVGVFGPWGSGKSYFMGLLRGQVDQLARSGDHSYHKRIAQIGFNAWHYADSNLWASLGDEIFRQLAGPRAEHGRAELRRQLTEKLEQKRVLEEATERARQAAAELRRKIDEAAQNRRTTARDLITALGSSQKFRAQLKEIWRRLGVSDPLEQGAMLADELHKSLHEAEILRRSAKNRLGWIALVTAVAVLVVFGGIALALPAIRSWLAYVISACGLLGIYSAATLRAVRSGLQGLHKLSAELRTGLAAAHAPAAEHLAALRKAEAAQSIAEAQLDDVIARVGQLGRELSELEPGARLYAFLAERAGSDSYTSQLGLVSTIRKDFEQLVELMRDWRPAAGNGKPVERIVLYIDDLDRCSPAQVVDVLEAVHLLLALELFVVVVGVDPRWLLSSICSHHAEVVGSEGVPPEDYLEKIINIPLILPGMAAGNLKSLLRSIIDQPAPAIVESPAATRTEAPYEGVIGIEPDSEVAQVQALEAFSPVERRRPTAAHPLTEPEIDVLSSLDSLIDTPRQAKRLFNLYRMLRATRDLSEVSEFLGTPENPGDYVAVALLLGVITGHAREFGPLLDTVPSVDCRGGLLRRSGTGSQEFLDDLRPQNSAGHWANAVAGRLTDGTAARWSRLHDGLAQAAESVELPELAKLQLWAPRIRRFSYVLSADPR